MRVINAPLGNAIEGAGDVLTTGARLPRELGMLGATVVGSVDGGDMGSIVPESEDDVMVIGAEVTVEEESSTVD